MRLRSKLNQEQVSLLYSILGSLTKIVSSELSSGTNPHHGGNSSSVGGTKPFLRHSVYLKFDPDHVRLAARGKSCDMDGLSGFVELKATEGGVFLQHQIESAASNVINLEVDLFHLRTALQSMVPAGANASINAITVLKLAKRNGQPCLCLESNSSHESSVQISHTVPVRVASPLEFPSPPDIPDPYLQLELIPHHNTLRSLLERYRNAFQQHQRSSRSILLRGSTNGELRVVLNKDGSTLQTFFRLLVQGTSSQTEEDFKDCKVHVDPRKLASCLQIVPNCSSALLCLEPNVILLHVRLPSGFSSFYLPVQYTGDDEDTDEGSSDVE